VKAAAALLLALGVPAAAQAPQRYTPVEVWRNAEDARFKEDWFGGHLASMQAPYLVPASALDGYAERVRLLVLPTFQAPYAVMFDRARGGRTTVRIAMTDGRGGYGTGKLVRDDQRPLPRSDWTAITAAMRAARLPERTTDNSSGAEFVGGAPPPSGLVFCTDGTRLVFETRTREGYRIVTRHECRLDAPMRDLTNTMLRAAGLTTDRSYIVGPRGSKGAAPAAVKGTRQQPL